MSKFKAVSIDAAFGLMERQVGGTTEVMANPIAPRTPLSFPAKAGNPVRRDVSIQSRLTEYWIARLCGR
ncbi:MULTISPECIES: hypothetical protein [unclassified Bradyrhizobium]|uniref:hypothetical protein n=1 Tax=unclassified Bradyrhizobium TaxID=2631580 RepID=UPI001FF9F496|nr:MULTISPECIES: hypothetical protein [unclassified Bradyrhizobium]MCK1321763.1 hypothetical protein [Bradyrhizobium sp. 156]UPJ98385.1 hypothetical protein IVB07_13320 [Bradyrhizobium sp. 172]